MGVADALLCEIEPDSAERFRFWLLTHTNYQGATLWRTAVLRECTPDPQGVLEFTACAQPLGGRP
jgi:hypothetical protein